MYYCRKMEYYYKVIFWTYWFSKLGYIFNLWIMVLCNNLISCLVGWTMYVLLSKKAFIQKITYFICTVFRDMIYFKINKINRTINSLLMFFYKIIIMNYYSMEFIFKLIPNIINIVQFIFLHINDWLENFIINYPIDSWAN